MRRVSVPPGVFWSPVDVVPVGGGADDDEDEPPDPPRPATRWMLAPTAVLVLCGLGTAVAAGPLYDLSERAARDLLSPSEYVSLVLER